MKKALYIIGIALAIAGCTKSEITENTPASGEISFSAGVTTRVGSGDNDCTWKSSGDEIGIFTSDGEKNLKFSVATGGAMTNESGTTLTTLASGARTYYAYHPYSDAQNATSIIEIDITTNSVPLLYAKETTNDTRVTLKFNHVLAKVSFTLTAGGLEVNDADLDDATAWITGVYTKSEFNLTTGKFASTDSKTINLTINSDNTIGPLYLLPSSDAKLWIKVNGNTFVKSLDEWVSGEEYEYDITVGRS